MSFSSAYCFPVHCRDHVLYAKQKRATKAENVLKEMRDSYQVLLADMLREIESTRNTLVLAADTIHTAVVDEYARRGRAQEAEEVMWEMRNSQSRSCPRRSIDHQWKMVQNGGCKRLKVHRSSIRTFGEVQSVTYLCSLLYGIWYQVCCFV